MVLETDGTRIDTASSQAGSADGSVRQDLACGDDGWLRSTRSSFSSPKGRRCQFRCRTRRATGCCACQRCGSARILRQKYVCDEGTPMATSISVRSAVSHSELSTDVIEFCSALAPGASNLLPKIESYPAMNRDPDWAVNDLSIKEWAIISHVFMAWPFRPKVRIHFLCDVERRKLTRMNRSFSMMEDSTR